MAFKDLQRGILEEFLESSEPRGNGGYLKDDDPSFRIRSREGLGNRIGRPFEHGGVEVACACCRREYGSRAALTAHFVAAHHDLVEAYALRAASAEQERALERQRLTADLARAERQADAARSLLLECEQRVARLAERLRRI